MALDAFALIKGNVGVLLLIVCQCYHRFKSLHTIPEDTCNNWPTVLSNCVFLQDAEVSVNGIRIYGTPW